jgi:Protein of unknown function (DUF4089)
MTDEAAIDGFVEAGTTLLGIPVQPDWRDGIRQHLRVSFAMGSVVLAFPLPDDAEPAPVFVA